MIRKLSARFFKSFITRSMALLGWIGVSVVISGSNGCGGDSGSGDANFSQKFEKPATATTSTTTPGKEAPAPAGNPDGQTAKARRAQDRAEDSKKK